jgi:phage/plasmid-like protein (TIGR03299 family)
MSAEVETMAYAGELPWHGLGELVDPTLTPLEMCKAAKVDWKVEKFPLFVELPYPSSYDIQREKVKVDRSALVRLSDNSILDVVGTDWNIVQNIEAFEFFNDFIKSGGMKMNTAGSLKQGKIVWALAKINESFEASPGDKIDSYLLFTNYHMFGHAIDVRFTPIRVVCNNTLTFALSSKEDSMVKVNHRHKFNAEEVKEILGLASNKLEQYKKTANLLTSKQYNLTNVVKYFEDLFPVVSTKDETPTKMSRNFVKVLDILDTQPGKEFAKNSWWNAFNAVTYFTDHVSNNTTDRRLTSAWYGVNRNLKIKAMEKATEYAMAS